MHGVGKIGNLDTYRCEVPLKLLALGRSPPIVTLEDDGESDLSPGVQLFR